MADLKVEQYRKAVEAVIDRWSKKVETSSKRIAYLNGEIERIGKLLECATEKGEIEYKAQIEKMKKLRSAEVEAIRSAGDSLRLEMMMLKMPERTPSNEKDLINLKGFIGDVVKKKGLPLGKSGIVLKPDVDIDFKAGKLKKLGLELKFEF